MKYEIVTILAYCISAVNSFLYVESIRPSRLEIRKNYFSSIFLSSAYRFIKLPACSYLQQITTLMHFSKIKTFKIELIYFTYLVDMSRD